MRQHSRYWETLKPRITLSDRLRSSYHRIWYEATQASRWSRGTYREAPSMTALNLSPLPCVRTEKLAAMYGTRFELRYPPKLTVLNYGYPDLLDRTRRAMNRGIFHHHQVCDVDSANFAYAGALQAFFHPSYLVGTEVDRHPLYCNEQSRNNDAHGHIQALFHANLFSHGFLPPTPQISSLPGIPSSLPNRPRPGTCFEVVHPAVL